MNINKQIKRIFLQNYWTIPCSDEKLIISQIKQSILKAIEEEINKMEKDINDRRTYLSVIKEVLK